MSEMVERVARALYVEIIGEQEYPAGDWPGVGDEIQQYYRAMARAAIAAMREPTKAMIEVMMYFDLERACHAEDNCTHYLWENEAPILWQAAIDEALK